MLAAVTCPSSATVAVSRASSRQRPPTRASSGATAAALDSAAHAGQDHPSSVSILDLVPPAARWTVEGGTEAHDPTPSST